MRADSLGSFSPTFRLDELTLVELEVLATEGKDVSIDDVVVLGDSTLSYKDSRVLVYIRDIATGGRQWAPRYHIADCKTLEQMRQFNKFEKYVVITRFDGNFPVNRISKNGNTSRQIEQLSVCQNCLNKLSFDNFSYRADQHRRLMIVSRFTISRFFEKYPRSLFHLRPRGDATTAPINNYPADFGDISDRLREQRSWRCECCRRDFSRQAERQYLHVHHKNGMKSENYEQYRQALCFGCHAHEPQHSHLKNLAEYHEFVRRFGLHR